MPLKFTPATFKIVIAFAANWLTLSSIFDISTYSNNRALNSGILVTLLANKLIISGVLFIFIRFNSISLALSISLAPAPAVSSNIVLATKKSCSDLWINAYVFAAVTFNGQPRLIYFKLISRLSSKNSPASCVLTSPDTYLISGLPFVYILTANLLQKFKNSGLKSRGGIAPSIFLNFSCCISKYFCVNLSYISYNVIPASSRSLRSPNSLYSSGNTSTIIFNTNGPVINSFNPGIIRILSLYLRQSRHSNSVFIATYLSKYLSICSSLN